MHKINSEDLLLPWQKEVMVGGVLEALVCLSVCLSVSEQHYSKSYQQIAMTFYGEVWGGTRKNWLNYGSDLGKWAKKT